MRCSQCRVAKYCSAKCQVRMFSHPSGASWFSALKFVCWPIYVSSQSLTYFNLLFYLNLKITSVVKNYIYIYKNYVTS